MSKPRLLLIINPRASTVKESDEGAVSTILSATYDVEVVKTCRQHHAQEIVEGLSTEDYVVVVAYSGDGTINERLTRSTMRTSADATVTRMSPSASPSTTATQATQVVLIGRP